MNNPNLDGFTDVLGDEIENSQESQPLSLSFDDFQLNNNVDIIPESFVTRDKGTHVPRPAKGTGQYGQFRSIDEVDVKYRSVFSYPFFNLVQSSVIEDALYSDKSMVVCAPTGSGKTVVFEMAIVQLLMEIEDKRYTDDFKIIYMAPVKALCTERLTEWYPKLTRLGLLCIEVTGDTDVDFAQLKPYKVIITTPEKWDMVTRRWREHRQLVEVIKLFLIDEVHILNDETRGPVLEAVVSRMKTIESSAQSAHRIEQLQKQYQGTDIISKETPPMIRFVAISATVGNPQDVAAWLGTAEKPAVYYKFGDESRPVKLKRVVEGYHCAEGTSIFKFDIILNYKLWPVIQKYHNGKPTLIFCNTRKSVAMTAETLVRELTVSFSPEQRAKLTALASTIKTKKLQALVLSGVGCHHAGLLFEERSNIEQAFRNRDLPILITTTTLAMGVNLPAHLVIIKNTQQYVNGAYQEYSISTILQMVGRAGRPQFDTEATAVIMTRMCDKPRYQSLVGGSEPLQSYLHKRLAENLNSEAALGTVNDVAQCVQWLRSTFLCVRAAGDPKRYLGLPQAAPQQLISKKIEELCVKAMNGLATSGLITMDEASCIESTEAGRLMSVFYLDLETMKHIMKINGSESLERLLWVICESHELSDMHLRVDERRCLNALNRNNAAATIRFPMKGKISSRQMKLNCIIQATLGCLNIPDPSLNQEAMKIMRIAHRVCKCLVAYVTRPALMSQQPKHYSAVLNALILTKCIAAHMWENSQFVSKQLKGIGPTFSTLLATAGKISFMLLEESHPRDLERIMNKGPPAGNVLRKQISLLPKYQITMMPIDEKSVTVQLVLVNQNYLSENMEHLTAGDTHRSYLVVGDSENNLLMFTSFKDKDLIGVYDGTIVHQITRKHSFEHKIYANCISSSFVGIDAQCEYKFQDLEAHHTSTNADFIRKPAIKQSTITDTFKERKRKNTSENDITQSKEKKKRDSALFEKFKSLKESFGKTSKGLKEDLNKSAVISNRILQELNPATSKSRDVIPLTTNDYSKIKPIEIDFKQNSLMGEMNTEEIESDDFIDDERFNSILHEIESEISKGNRSPDLPQVNLGVVKNTQNVQSPFSTKLSGTSVPQPNDNLRIDNFKALNNTKKRIQKNIKSNYNFIDLLEKNMDLSDEEETLVTDKSTGFSDTIKNQIEKYIRGSTNISKVPDISIRELLQTDDTVKNNEDTTVHNLQTTNITDIETIESNKGNNEIPHELQDILDVNLKKSDHIEIDESSMSAKRDDHAIKSAIENKNQDTYPNANESIKDNNYTVSSTAINTIQTNSCGSEVNTTDDTVKQFCYQNVSPTKNIYTHVDVTRQNENNSKTHDLVVLDDAKALISVARQSIDTELERDVNETTVESNIKKGTSTSILALPYNQSHSPAYSVNPESQRQIVNKDNTFNLIMEPNFAKLTSTGNSDQFVSLPEVGYDTYDNYANASNQNMNVRKGSYSTTRIDIGTKNDHTLKLIRMIKMDLNITEIVTYDNKENNKLLEIEDDLQNEDKRNTENRIKDLKLPDERIEQPQGEEIQNAIIAYNKSNVNDDVINRDIQGIFREKTKQILQKPKPTLPISQIKFQNTQIEQIDRNSDTKVKEDHVANEKSSDTNTSPQIEGKQIGNILQKYSKILRKNNTGNLSQSLTQPKAMEKVFHNTPLERPKRPYKITDIHNLNIPLPKTLIRETPKRENEGETFIEITKQKNITEVENEIEECSYQELEPNDDIFQYPSETIKLQKDINTKLSALQNEDITENFEEVPNYNVLDIENLQPRPTEIEYNIDQSMFNPKTLLQSLSKDIPDDIVPPPPEFCDESELTPRVADLTVPKDCYEPMLWDNFDDSYNHTNENIIQDDSHIELTPSREIETWTLSQNEESHGNLATSTSLTPPTQSFTIIHNSGQYRSPFQNVSVSRQTRLRQFKFSHKSKYLPKI